MPCAHGPRDGMKRVREYVYRRQLDLDTLVSTRGPNFPLRGIVGPSPSHGRAIRR